MSGADLNRHDAGDSRDGEGAHLFGMVVIGRERSATEANGVNQKNGGGPV